MCVYRQAIPSLLFLKSAYENLAWYKKIFFPGTLAKALKEVSEKTEAKAIHTICMAVENSWFSRFFVCLRQFEQSEIMIFFRASDKTKLTSVIALPDESKPYALASGVALSSSPGSDLSGEATAKELMQQRAFVEKKDKLADKCNELMRLVTMDVQHLDTLCIPYESTIRNCDRIKVELRYQELQKSAMKIDPNATDKQFVGMFCCKCGARSRNFGYCFQ